MSKTTYDAEPIASNWLETRDSNKDLLPSNPCCLFTYEDAYDKSIPSREKTLQCKCGYCGKIFLISKHDAQEIITKNNHLRFCSIKCGHKFVGSMQQKHFPHEYQCELCGKHVSINNYYGSGRFCSEKCARSFATISVCPEKRKQKISNGVKRRYRRILNYTPISKEYHKACNFNFSNHIDKFLPGYELYQKYGWYNKFNNKNGATKDHMISISYGFHNHIDPYLISHPANCMIMIGEENYSKNDKCSITVNELIERVEWFNNTILYKTENEMFKTTFKNKLYLTSAYSNEQIHHFLILI